MPSLQLDVPATHTVAVKRALARELGAVYAEVMDARPELVTVVIRDLGEGAVWRCDHGEPVAAALLMCDIRRGRPAETLAALSRRLIAVCAAALALDPGHVKVEFTQHAGDEMYHPQLGGFNREWEPGESTQADVSITLRGALPSTASCSCGAKRSSTYSRLSGVMKYIAPASVPSV